MCGCVWGAQCVCVGGSRLHYIPTHAHINQRPTFCSLCQTNGGSWRCGLRSKALSTRCNFILGAIEEYGFLPGKIIDTVNRH